MNKKIVMTGGSSGIGEATAKKLVEHGHHVISLDIKAGANPEVDHRLCDLSAPSSIDTAVSTLSGTFSALLNIAGVPARHGADLTMKVNLFGLRYLTEQVWDKIEEGGTVVNVASLAGNNWRKRRGLYKDLLATGSFAEGLKWWRENADKIGTDAYVFSKEAVVVYTMMLAGKGIKRNITVNDVGPGPVETPLLPDFTLDTGEDNMAALIDITGRAATPDEIAEAVIVLAERRMSWLNGRHIVVDGGATAAYSTGWA